MTGLRRDGWNMNISKDMKESNNTWGNKIRSMTDEELADFIDYNEVDCARFCPDYKAGCSWTCKHNQGKDFLLKWLKSEAE